MVIILVKTEGENALKHLQICAWQVNAPERVGNNGSSNDGGVLVIPPPPSFF